MNKNEDFCILRVIKLSTFGSIAGSAAHTFREISTPNVDANRTHLNWTIGASSSADIVNGIKAVLPQKRRKDAVLCLEYLVTASPTWFISTSEKVQECFFERAIEWLKARHNFKNIVCLNCQLDETSPHLVAYIVPITPDGRLTAKSFVGGRAQLSMMQTDFWNTVGKPLGLSRGLLGSTAKHISAKQYSATLHKKKNSYFPAAPVVSFLDRLNGNAERKQSEYRRALIRYKRTVEQMYNLAILKDNARLQHKVEHNILLKNNEEIERFRKEFIDMKEKEALLIKDSNNKINQYIQLLNEINSELADTRVLIDSLSRENACLKIEIEAGEKKISDLCEKVAQLSPRKYSEILSP